MVSFGRLVVREERETATQRDRMVKRELLLALQPGELIKCRVAL